MACCTASASPSSAKDEAMTEPLSDREIAYLAGFFDGEGCVSILRFAEKRRAATYFAYRLQVRIGNTNLEVLEWIQSKFGGTIYDQVRSVPGNRKPFWAWHTSGHKAKTFLEMIEPFVIVKRRQIQVALQFLSLGRHQHVPAARAALCGQMAELNFRGVGQRNSNGQL